MTGTLERRTNPGRPNYESVAAGDEAETNYFLALKEPFCVLPKSAAPENGPVDGGTSVQLFLDQRGYDRLRPQLGTELTLRGILWEGVTGHHHTPFLLTVIFAPGT
jgi:hypothetical protein